MVKACSSGMCRRWRTAPAYVALAAVTAPASQRQRDAPAARHAILAEAPAPVGAAVVGTAHVIHRCVLALRRDPREGEHGVVVGPSS